MFTKNGTYRATKEKYPVMEALAYAVAVDRDQGFVKSGHSFCDSETGKKTFDNRTRVLNNLRAESNKFDDLSNDIVVTDQDREQAHEIFELFSQICLMKKISDQLVEQSHNGKVNDYNLVLNEILSRGETDVNKELAMLVSLPNSRRVYEKREMLEVFYRTHQTNGYVGSVGQRIKVSGQVIDIKPIPKHGLHLALFHTDCDRVVRFFMSEKLLDFVNAVIGQAGVSIVGTVTKQEVNKFSGCQETVMNRVKIL